MSVSDHVDLNQFISIVETIEQFWLTVVKLPSVREYALA